MLLKRKFEILLLIVFSLFSFWLMDKSFGYDEANHTFRIARHQVGDFGLHLSLIRSFSWGNNFPVEFPFFPGKPLPYHYYFDLIVGFLERAGVRIDVAFNGLSIFFFTGLLFLIYKLPQLIFNKSRLLGLISVLLFIFHSNLTFLDFIKNKKISPSLFSDLWYLPNYINMGPFDNSIISIFFTLNVFVNQRHLVAALSISLFVLYFVIDKVIKNSKFSKKIIFLGIMLGVLSRFHALIFFTTVLTLLILLLFFKRFRAIPFLFIPAFVIFSFHLKDILGQDLSHILINPGFLAEKPLTLLSFGKFWFLNLGLAMFLIPLGFFLSDNKQKKIFLSFLPLFLIGNIFQFSFRIDHNHALFNMILIFANFYIAYFLIKLWQQKVLGKIFFSFLLFLLTFSGLIDLMALKNDFQFPLKDASSNKFMLWIKNNTGKNDIFLSRQEILDPVTLSGRRNYLGHDYYLSVLGYNFSERKKSADIFWEAKDQEVLRKIRKEEIKFIVIPKKKVADFNYNINVDFLKKNLKLAFQDEEVIVFSL